jgi:hypothetical protein
MPTSDIQRAEAVIFDESLKAQYTLIESLRSIEVGDIESGLF